MGIINGLHVKLKFEKVNCDYGNILRKPISTLTMINDK